MGGDFDILHHSDDKNKKFVNNRFLELFNRIINMYELRDLALQEGKCTWSNNRADPTLGKLGRVFISEKCKIKKIPRYVSDHNPIVYSNDMKCWDPEEKITEEENSKLTETFSIEEVKTTVFSMEKNTGPGLDHLPI